MKARGRTRKILKLVGEIQNLVGAAEYLHYNDRDQQAFVLAQEKLRTAHQLCIDIMGMYEPIDVS